MNKDTVQNALLDALAKQFPDRGMLVKTLMELLHIEKEAAYRRLRGEAPFLFEEAVLIAETIGISLDNLLQIDLTKSSPFHLILVDFEQPTDEDYQMCESYMRLLRVFSNDLSTHSMEVCNSLPFPLTYQYPGLTRFYSLKWIYQFKNYSPPVTFSEVNIPDRYIGLQKETLQEARKLARTEWVLSYTIFSDLVKDILCFYDLQLIKKSEIRLLYEELTEYLSFLEQLAVKGCFPETGNPVTMYVSNIKIETNQSYIHSDIYNFAMFKVLTFNGISSVDGTENRSMQNWFAGMKRLSHRISVSNEKERIDFFTDQRAAVESLVKCM